MSSEVTTQTPLNEVQIMLLRLFSRKMSKAEMQAIKKMLLEFYEKELQVEVEKIIEEKNISRQDFENRLNQQQRTK